MGKKNLLKLILSGGILFLTILSLFIIFARDEAQEFYGLKSTTVTGDANFLFYPLTIYMFLIFCSVMYFKTEQLKYLEAILLMCSAFLTVRVFSLVISGVENQERTNWNSNQHNLYSDCIERIGQFWRNIECQSGII